MFARLPVKTALGAAALAAAGLMLTPAAASAQSYTYQGAPQSYGYSQPYGYGQQDYGYGQQDYGYDQSRSGYDRAYGQSRDRAGDYCRSERRQRQGTGAAVGATFGAVVGSQLGARGRRTEGSLLGAVIGGALGAAVSSDPARGCDDGYRSQARYRYDDRGYGDSSRYRYEDRGYSSQGGQYGYEDRYDDRAYGDDRYDDYRSDCRSVAVTTRDSYGRTVTRYEQAC